MGLAFQGAQAGSRAFRVECPIVDKYHVVVPRPHTPYEVSLPTRANGPRHEVSKPPVLGEIAHRSHANSTGGVSLTEGYRRLNDGGMSEQRGTTSTRRWLQPQPRPEPPLGSAFMGLTMAGIVGTGLAMLGPEAVLEQFKSVTFVTRMGVASTTILSITTLLCVYRAVVSTSWIPAVMATVLYGPAALWSWLIFVEGSVPSSELIPVVLIVSGFVSMLLLARGLVEARWLEVFGGLAAAELVFSVRVITGDEPQESLVFVASLVALSGVTGLYGLLVDLELSAYQRLNAILQSNETLIGENRRNEALLHDVRSGLLSIETAARSSESELAAPVSSEAARLRRLTAVRRNDRPSFDLSRGVRELATSKTAAGAALALSVPPSVEVSGDESEVLAIVENLITNAQRHGRPPVEIQIKRADETVELSVADNGDGIDESLRDRVFERGVTTDPDGTGLGLARARDLAERNNARLVLDASSSSKTRFVLALKTSLSTMKER